MEATNAFAAMVEIELAAETTTANKDTAVEETAMKDNAAEQTALGSFKFGLEEFCRTDCPTLPATLPRGWPHVIDAEEYYAVASEWHDSFFLRCADGVATFLWYWDKTQFANFFNFQRNDFRLQFQRPAGPVKSMVIKRRGHIVKVGYRLGEEEGYVKWDEKLVFEIQFNGSWRAVCCRSKSHTGTDASLAHALGIYFAETVLEQRLWDTSRPTAMVTVIE